MLVKLHAFDYLVMAAYVVIMGLIGVYFAKRARESQESFFTAGGSLPWYVIAVTSVVAVLGGLPIALCVYYTHGIATRWIVDTQFMIFVPLVAIFLTPLWRRLDLKSTPEFFRHRYGDESTSCRAFRTVYGLFMAFGWGSMLMGYILGYTCQSIAMPVFGVSPWILVVVLCAIVVLYSASGGFYGVAYAGLVQFAMYAVAFMVSVPIVINAAGGWEKMYASVAASNPQFLNPFPGGKGIAWSMWSVLLFQSLFLGVHPNFGEGFIAQRFLAAKSPAHAKIGLIVGCVISAICILLPTGLLATGAAALNPGLSDEAAKGIYARLLAMLPPGVLGLLMVGELAVIIGVIASLTNWGASVITNDVYRLHLVKHGSEKHYVRMGMMFGLVMLFVGGWIGVSLVDSFFSWFVFINTATMTFILPIGFMRYFWWRFNIWGEIVGIAVGVPFCVLVWFVLGGSQWPFWQVFLTLFGSGAVVITLTAILTNATDRAVLEQFYRKCQPPGFWGPVRKSLAAENHAAYPASFGWASLAEFAVTLGALACMFLAINAFLGHRLWLACAAGGGFVVLGGVVVAISIRSLAEESKAEESNSHVSPSAAAAGPDLILSDVET
jgi:Na+/proline symporter